MKTALATLREIRSGAPEAKATPAPLPVTDPAVADHLALDRAGWTAADWRGQYEERAAVLEYEGGMDRAAAESRAFVELAVEWTVAHPEVDALPSAEAEPIAAAALAPLGVATTTQPRARA